MSLSNVSAKVKIMAEFKPLQAWRYNPEKTAFGKVMAPPYDIISPREQKKLYARSPFNCIRLILNREEPKDDALRNRYTRARDFFQAWQREGVLAQEKEPCFYLYRQSFKDPRDGKIRKRFALLGRLGLEPFEKGIVIPHEKTLSKPRQDRRKLLEMTHTNFSPVFGLYEDRKAHLLRLFSRIVKQKSLFDVPDDEKVRHALWVVKDAAAIGKIQKNVSRKKIYIADGHHRYQTALEYARDRHLEEKTVSESRKPFDYVLMALVEFHDPGLVLLPTHRMLLPWPGFDFKEALDSLKKFFKIEKCSVANLEKKIRHPAREGEISFGVVTAKGAFFLTLTEKEKARKAMLLNKPPVWYHLDVNILSELVFRSCWKLPPDLGETVIQYTRSMKEAVTRIKKGEAAASFLLKPPRVEFLQKMGKVRELMPQKSTYFYPKLASGLVFYHHDSVKGEPHGN